MDSAPRIASIIRTHRFDDLRRFETALACVFGQEKVEVTAFVVAQKPEPEEFERLKRACNLLSWIYARPYRLIAVHDGPADARTRLLNVALNHIRAEGGFDAFGVLDSDDVLFKHAYATLYDGLVREEARIAFARVHAADVAPCGDYDRLYRLSCPWVGRSKSELMRGNFAPIHSYLVSLKPDTPEIRYDEAYERLEDYEFLLRIGSAEKLTFRNVGVFVGLYNFYSNEENSTPRTSDSRESLEEKERMWNIYRDRILYFRSTLEVKFWASEF